MQKRCARVRAVTSAAVLAMKEKARHKGAAPWSAHLRCQAKLCLGLAEKATEYWVAASLTELAEDYLNRAARAEITRSARRDYASSTSTRVSL
jgi:hypothetical protein